MKIWSFKVFVDKDGRDTFEEWITSLDVDAEERIRARIRYLSITKIWARPFFDVIHGQKGIHEIRVKSKNIQYRPLGCFGPDRYTFILLIGASKKGNAWSPKNAIKKAGKRRELTHTDRRCLGEYQP